MKSNARLASPNRKHLPQNVMTYHHGLKQLKPSSWLRPFTILSTSLPMAFNYCPSPGTLHALSSTVLKPLHLCCSLQGWFYSQVYSPPPPNSDLVPHQKDLHQQILFKQPLTGTSVVALFIKFISGVSELIIQWPSLFSCSHNILIPQVFVRYYYFQPLNQCLAYYQVLSNCQSNQIYSHNSTRCSSQKISTVFIVLVFNEVPNI